MNYIKYFILLLFALGSSIAFSQNCSVNAGGNVTICGTTHTLAGSAGGNTNGAPTWTIVSKPAGAPDPVISDINSYTPDVTDLDFPGTYVFEISQPCGTGTVTSQVTITAPGSVATHTAGPDITNVSAVVGEVTLNGVIPPGYTGEWTAVHIHSNERFGTVVSTNSQFSSTTSATPTFSLINKANHEVDPAYRVILTITSINNPNCSYVDEAIVRFIPNPEIQLNLNQSYCMDFSNPLNYIDVSSASPKFSTATPGSSGNPSYGTTVTMNVLSQPVGANIAFDGIRDNGRIHLSGAGEPGIYTFTLTIANASGSHTTGTITYTNNGTRPGQVSFLDPAYPHQMALYNAGGSGGAVYCGVEGTTDPITFFFKINPADPTTVTTAVDPSGVIPPGGTPTVTVSGAGTHDRSATVTPPAGGWSVGTYRFRMYTSSGECSTTQDYYIHISDGNREDVSVPNTTVCYPGSGVVTATIPLPDIYKEVVNSSYFQDFNGRYDFTVVSRPEGSAVPTFQAANQRTITNSSTVISNLNREGEYVFTIKAVANSGGIGQFLDKEYECSDAVMEGTFSVFVSTQINANAGSNQSISCPIGATITMNGNNPGVASIGEWTIESKPAGAPDPIFSDATLRNTEVSGFGVGEYTLRWTITTGDCISFDETTITVSDLDCPAPGGVTGVDFWIKSDDAGDITTAWKDHSANLDDIPAVGDDWTLSPADGNHNFHPYTTGYANNRNFYNPESMLNPQPTGNTYGASDPMGHSIFSAVRPTTAANGRITGIDNESNTAAEPGISITSNGLPRHYEFLNTSTSDDFSTPFNIGSTNIFSAIADNSVDHGGSSTFSGGEKRLGLNGAYELFEFNNNNQFQLVNQHLRVGYGTHNVNGPFPGDIMEVIWYKRALTENEQSRVNAYLAIKNGVTLSEDYLSAASTVVFDQTVNAGYTDNIFGIAKDDASALHQRQSKSVNPSQRLIIGAGSSLAETNADNSNDLDEGQFLIVGDNGLEQGLRVPLAYTDGTNGETNLRFASIWKTQNTGSVGTVTVAWPKGVRNLYLVQSSDDVIDLSDDFVPMTDEVTIGGVVYNTATVTLDNYFTFAGFGNAPGGVTTALSYWYRADIDAENTGVGTDVTGWTDVWAGTTVAQAATLPLPKYAEGAVDYFNFNSGINFTDQNQSLANLGVRTVTNNEYDIFTVTKEGLSGSGWARIFSALYDNAYLNGNIHYWDGIGINFWDNANAYERSNSPGGWIVPSGINPAVPFSATITNIMYHKFGDTNVSRGLNGGVYSTSSTHASVGFQNGGHAFGNTIFPGNGSDNPGITGHIGETIIYGAGNLSDTERRRVDSYLAIKYGITLGRVDTDHYLDANEEIVWDGAADALYNNNIFGVAREDIGLFEQKVSKSVNPGSILTIATINDFVNPNQDATRTGFANDHTYFLLGDNNVTDTPTENIEIDGENYKRIQRAWLSQRQNTPGDLHFQADLLAYGANFSLLNDVVMIIADDEDFTVNVRAISGVNEIGKWIHNYNFNSDAPHQYITYGVKEEQCLPEFVWSSPVSASGNTATGTIDGIGYTYTSNQTVFTSPAIFDSYNVFPDSTGSTDIFSFPRTGHSVIRNTAVTSNTITFDEPVTDPVLVFSSIGGPAGAVPVVFGQPIEVLWMDHRSGGSWSVSQDSPTQITGHEGYAIVRVPGTHTSISFDYTEAENYANFLFGVSKDKDCDNPSIIITNPMLINQLKQ